jgi:hypothetical protein
MTLDDLRGWLAHPNGDPGGNMNRAIFVALGTGAIITSAAAFTAGGDGAGGSAATQNQYRRAELEARAAQRARIEARYQVDRAKCDDLGGFKRDKCLVQVHATRGRAMLAAAQPYEVRF